MSNCIGGNAQVPTAAIVKEPSISSLIGRHDQAVIRLGHLVDRAFYIMQDFQGRARPETQTAAPQSGEYRLPDFRDQLDKEQVILDGLAQFCDELEAMLCLQHG